jgi:hypothetical protein
MKKCSNLHVCFLIIMTFFACKKSCDLSYRIGEIVQIPIQFNGFSLSEIERISVFRVDKTNPKLIDTFLLKEILWEKMARTNNEIITDHVPSKINKEYTDYESYLNNCSLIFNWKNGSDTLANFEIYKSKESLKGCHENDANIQIDKLYFEHKRKSINKNEMIEINR